jgi:predicted PurR-regulated permease PerM
MTSGELHAAGSPRRPPSDDAGAHERVIAFRLRSILAVLGVVLAVAAVVELVLRARAGLTLIAIAGFAAIALNPAVAAVERRGFARRWAVAAVYIAAAMVVTGVVLVLVPPLVEQVSRFVATLPDLVAQLIQGRGPLGFLETKYHVVERVRAATSSGGTSLLNDAASAVSAVRGLATSVFGIVVIAFLTLFMLLEGPAWQGRVVALAPERNQALVERIGAGVYRCIAGFVTGNLLASLLAAVVVTVVMLVAGVPYALPLGLFVGIVDLVPFIGPVVATLVVSMVALAQGTETALTVFVLLVAYHMIEGHTVRPLLYGRAVDLSPLAVLVSLLLCTEIAGILGALAAIPIAGTIGVVVRELVPRDEAPAGEET